MFNFLSVGYWEATFPALNYSIPFLGGIELVRVVGAVTVFILLNALFWLVRRVLLNRLKKIASKTTTNYDDALIGIISAVRSWVYSIVSLYFALQFFSFGDLTNKIILAIFLLAVTWQVIEVATSLVKFFATNFLEKDEDGDGLVDPNSATASNMVALISKIVLWSLGFLFVLSNLGIEVTALIAGLGVGGVAIAFALQGILSDLFASFSIYFDKPFRIGDFIVVGQDVGTVEKIGIKSTRIKALQGEELVISNNELTSARIQNFKKMAQRRIVTTFGITYETPQELVRQVPGIVERVFSDLDGGQFDRAHFTSFGDSALLFEVVYYINSSDYNEYLNIQQGFNFDLMKRFSEIGIEFAYPTQTIYTKST